MLSCKDVATRASEFLDNNALDQSTSRLRWQMRLHLMMCSHCRRFIRHLKLTQTVARGVVDQQADDLNPEIVYQQVLKRIKADKQSDQPRSDQPNQ